MSTWPEMVTLKEASRRCGLPYNRLREMCVAGEVACLRSGAKWYLNWPVFCDMLNTVPKKQEDVNDL